MKCFIKEAKLEVKDIQRRKKEEKIWEKLKKCA